MSDYVLMLAFAAVAALSSTGRAGDYFTVRSSDRDYEVLTVSGQPLSSDEPGDTAAKPALIIGLHGYGINEKQMATLVPLTLQVPHVYVAPRGDYDLGDGSYGWFPVGVVDGKPFYELSDLRAATERVVRLVPPLLEATGCDPNRVVLVGYSQGAVVSMTAAIEHPHRFAAVASLSGRRDTALAVPDESSGFPLFVGHGLMDHFVTREEMQQSAEWLRAANYELTYREYNIPHVVSRREREDVQAWADSVLMTFGDGDGAGQ